MTVTRKTNAKAERINAVLPASKTLLESTSLKPSLSSVSKLSPQFLYVRTIMILFDALVLPQGDCVKDRNQPFYNFHNSSVR